LASISAFLLAAAAVFAADASAAACCCFLILSSNTAFAASTSASAALTIKIGNDAVKAAIDDSKSQAVLAQAMMNTVGATNNVARLARNSESLVFTRN